MDVPVMTTQQFFKPGEHFHMQVSTDFPDFVGVAHRHEYIEVVYVLSGAATHVVEDKSSPARQGDLFLINVAQILPQPPHGRAVCGVRSDVHAGIF